MPNQVNRAPAEHTTPKRIVVDENGIATNVLPPSQQLLTPEALAELAGYNTAEFKAVEMALADGKLGVREAALLRGSEYDPKTIEQELQRQGGPQAVKDYQRAKEMFAAIDAAWANGEFDNAEVDHLRALGKKLGYTNEQIAGAINKLHGPFAAQQFTIGKLEPLPAPFLPEEPWRPTPWPNPRYPMPGGKLPDSIPLPRQTLDRPGPWGLRPIPLPQQTLPDRTGPDGAQPVPLPKVE